MRVIVKSLQITAFLTHPRTLRKLQPREQKASLSSKCTTVHLHRINIHAVMHTREHCETCK